MINIFKIGKKISIPIGPSIGEYCFVVCTQNKKEKKENWILNSLFIGFQLKRF